MLESLARFMARIATHYSTIREVALLVRGVYSVCTWWATQTHHKCNNNNNNNRNNNETLENNKLDMND